MSRVTTRKRAAPGAEPAQYQHSQNFPQMSSNQYGQWSPQLMAQPSPSYTTQSSTFGQQLYNPPAEQSQATPNQQNQLARRPVRNQLAQRQGLESQSGGNTWDDASLAPAQRSLGFGMGGGEDLNRMAEVAKREMQANRKQIPPFVQKLSSFLDESRKTDLIRWSDDGDSFIVFDEDEFANTLIPELFKHKKFTSFVRQLNMYGFHKKVGLSDNSMRASERKNKSPIQKPKNTSSKAGKNLKTSKQDESEDENEDVFDVDSPTTATFGRVENGNTLRSNRQPLMLSGPEGGGGGQVSDALLLNVQAQLQQVQKSQVAIATMMKKIINDHDSLSQKASLFQGLHEKHESSINAILTFLASVYSKSLDGNQTANVANMFASPIPQNAQSQSGVLDTGDYNTRRRDSANQNSQHPRKPQLLLQAPGFNENQSGRMSTTSPADSTSTRTPIAYPGDTTQPKRPQQHRPSQQDYFPVDGQSIDANSPNAQEVFDRTPSAQSTSSSQMNGNADEDKNLPETDIMDLINAHINQNSANANDLAGGVQMDFPEVLSHLQGGETSGQLTPSQQDNMLQLISRNGSHTGDNATDLFAGRPSPEAIESMEQYNQTKGDLDFLGNAIREQNQKVDELGQILAPLSPSGSIPGLAPSDPNDSLTLDLDRYFNESYFQDGVDFDGQPNVDSDGNAHVNSNIGFDVPGNQGTEMTQGIGGLDISPVEEEEGRVVGSVGTSEATSPANTAGYDEGSVVDSESSLPHKRQRRQ